MKDSNPALAMTLVNQVLQDPNQALMYAIILVIVTNLIMAGVQYFLQNRQLNRQTEHIKMQLEEASENLKKQLAQNEKNIRIQLLHPVQIESVNALWLILFNTEAHELKEKLMEFLNETSLGFYLPSDIQKKIRDEISNVDSFLRDTAIELGMVSPEQEAAMIEDYYEYYSETDPIERANIDTYDVYKRFEARIKDQIRKHTSISE